MRSVAIYHSAAAFGLPLPRAALASGTFSPAPMTTTTPTTPDATSSPVVCRYHPAGSVDVTAAESRRCGVSYPTSTNTTRNWTFRRMSTTTETATATRTLASSAAFAAPDNDGASSSSSSKAPPPTKMKLIRLSKRMSELDLCSRREADRLIKAGRVAVLRASASMESREKGRVTVASLGMKVPHDEVDIVILRPIGEWMGSAAADAADAPKTSAFDWSRMRGDVVALHKPPGYVSGQPEFPDRQVPAVRLLTRSNLYVPGDGGEGGDDEANVEGGGGEEEKEVLRREVMETLRSGRYLHFTRRFGIRKVRGRGRSRRRGWDREADSGYNEDGDVLRDLPNLEATLSGYVPAGRLDMCSSGLLLFTKSGVFAKKIVSSNSAVDKEYVAEVVPALALSKEERRAGLRGLPRPNRNLGPLLRGGRALAEVEEKGWEEEEEEARGNDDDRGDEYNLRGRDRARGRRQRRSPRPLKPAVEAEWLSSPDLRDTTAPPGVLRLVLREGRKHQVRKMCRQILGLHVVRLRRTRVGGLRLGWLPEGMWRPLTEKEGRSIFFAE